MTEPGRYYTRAPADAGAAGLTAAARSGAAASEGNSNGKSDRATGSGGGFGGGSNMMEVLASMPDEFGPDCALLHGAVGR